MTTHLFGDYCLDVPEYDPRGLEFLDDLAEEGGVCLRAAAVLRSFGTRHGCNVEGSVHPVRDWAPRERWLGGHGRFAEASESRLILRWTSQKGFFTQRRWVIEILLSTSPQGSVTQESLMLPGDVLYPVGLGAATTSGDGTGWHIVPVLQDPKQVGQLLRRRLIKDGVAARADWLESHNRENEVWYLGGYPEIVPWDDADDEYAAALDEGITALAKHWEKATPVPSDWYDRSTYQSPLPGVVIAHQ